MNKCYTYLYLDFIKSHSNKEIFSVNMNEYFYSVSKCVEKFNSLSAYGLKFYDYAIVEIKFIDKYKGLCYLNKIILEGDDIIKYSTLL